MPIACLVPDSHAHTGRVNYLLLGAQSADQDIPPTIGGRVAPQRRAQGVESRPLALDIERGFCILRVRAARPYPESTHEATRSVSSVMGLAMRLTHENRRKLGATVIAAVLMALGPVLMTQSKVDGEYPYSVPVCNLLAEIMKLCISATFLAVSHGLCREPSAEPPAPQHGHMCPWPRSGSARTQRSRRPPAWAGLPHG